jgi:hypothetical protein
MFATPKATCSIRVFNAQPLLGAAPTMEEHSGGEEPYAQKAAEDQPPLPRMRSPHQDYQANKPTSVSGNPKPKIVDRVPHQEILKG